MRISVILPCHNAERWIAMALNSVVNQSFPAYEIIVIDDHSTDDSLAKIANSGVPVTLLRVNAHNAAAARNAGIEAAKGNWLALLDADDIWYPDHLARFAEMLANSNDVAFMSSHDWISLSGERIAMPCEYQCKLSQPQSGMSTDDYFRISRDGFHFGHSTVLYRRDRVLAVGMFDVAQKRRHDIDLWLRVIAGHTWTYDTVKGVGYREATPNSISKDELECDYYYLRALVKNLIPSDSPLYREHLSRESRRAMGISFVDGCSDHYARIHALAWPHLSWPYRVAYTVGALCPELLRTFIKIKRKSSKAVSCSHHPGVESGLR